MFCQVFACGTLPGARNERIGLGVGAVDGVIGVGAVDGALETGVAVGRLVDGDGFADAAAAPLASASSAAHTSAIKLLWIVR